MLRIGQISFLDWAPRPPRIFKKCFVCQKIISIKYSHAGKEGTYCSRNCMRVDYRNRLKGMANPHYKDGRAIATKLIEYLKTQRKLWGKANKEKISLWNRAVKAKRKKAIGRHCPSDIRGLFIRQRGECAICSCKLLTYHLDHIIPLARGGSNYIGNLQILCGTCNSSKKDKLPIEFRFYRLKRSK